MSSAANYVLLPDDYWNDQLIPLSTTVLLYLLYWFAAKRQYVKYVCPSFNVPHKTKPPKNAW